MRDDAGPFESEGGAWQPSVAERLTRLRRRGIGLTLDHFGTCHGSLTRLKQVRMDRMEIDRSLVGELASDRENAANVRAVLHLGRALGHEIIADGIETREQLDVLRRLGCARGQGRYFGAPAPAPAIEPVLRSARIATGGERDPVPAA